MNADTEPTEGGHEEPVRNGHRRDGDDAGRTGVVVERLDDGTVRREVVEPSNREGAVEVPDTEPAVEQPATGQPVERPPVEQPTAERQTTEYPTAERPTAEQPTVERPTVERSAEEGATQRQVRTLLLALPAALVTLWVALFVPLQFGLVLGAMAAVPVAIVAVPWLVSVAATALIDRGP